MRRWMIAAILLIAPALAAADSGATGKVREIMNSRVKADGPGAAVAVLRNGEVLFQGGFGLANVDERLAIGTETNFDLASCSKQFTAMGIMILAEREKLGFEDEVRKYLPELPRREGRAMRIGDLLHMTSGLADYTELMPDLTDKTNVHVLHRIAKEPARFEPGERFKYSNTNYVLLALIVERVSKRKFADFLDEEIFRPVGMNGTVLLDHAGQAVGNRAMGYVKGKRGYLVSRNDAGVVGDGQVMSSVTDLAKWDRAIRVEKLVKHETQMMAFTAGRLNDGKSCGYGFGWDVRPEDGKPFAGHTGGWAGTSTAILKYLDDGVTVIVLSNDEKFDAWGAGKEIARALWEGK